MIAAAIAADRAGLPTAPRTPSENGAPEQPKAWPILAGVQRTQWRVQVLVDEYQDTNRLQASILLALKPTGKGLTVVGDDAESIYSFRAATVRNILDFPAQFNPPAAIVTLERNYRSTQSSNVGHGPPPSRRRLPPRWGQSLRLISAPVCERGGVRRAARPGFIDNDREPDGWH
jgi:hypothetical protein